jgi:uncharacterized protein YdhG (YjbR/CyaY superfamily)
LLIITCSPKKISSCRIAPGKLRFLSGYNVCMQTVNEYLEGATDSQRKALENIRQLVKRLVPEAEETISYGVPTFKVQKKPLIYYAAFKNHMSIFPASDAMVEELGEELNTFRTSKGTMQFTESNQIPETLLEQIILFRLADISE